MLPKMPKMSMLFQLLTKLSSLCDADSIICQIGCKKNVEKEARFLANVGIECIMSATIMLPILYQPLELAMISNLF